MIRLQKVVRGALGAVVGVAYAYFSYLAAVTEHPSMLVLIIGVVPLAAVAIVAAWHSSFRWAALAICVTIAAAMLVKLDFLRNHVAWLYFIQHAGAMTFLGILFGCTLGRDAADALCSRIACFMLRKQPDAEYLRYTWNVTLAWTLFFAACALTSIALFAFASTDIWSIFANLLTPILLGAMFVGEYLIRLRVLPGHRHFSIAATIRAYREYSRH